MKAKCLGALRGFCGEGKAGLRDAVGGWAVVGWRAVWRPRGLRASSSEGSFFLQYARQVLDSSESS